VRDACDVLLDDGPRVQLTGRVVRSGADDLHTTLVGPAAAAAAAKNGNQQVVVSAGCRVL
jgi:hypothetical protein